MTIETLKEKRKSYQDGLDSLKAQAQKLEKDAEATSGAIQAIDSLIAEMGVQMPSDSPAQQPSPDPLPPRRGRRPGSKNQPKKA